MANMRLSIDYMVEFRTAFHGSLNRRRADDRRMPNLTRARQPRNQHKKTAPPSRAEAQSSVTELRKSASNAIRSIEE
ncbi:hypothetical protein MPC4_230034 [Methylocella tundrae]|uniref:Uncharacterized protein n=1 Tax=Methylocella tundrae TaxID=227605 RepID=A0A8B6M7J0_METTU|nr:hypothetical protein MPC4_230034 [Methylocella tundrae]